jgi:hypothetical protein
MESKASGKSNWAEKRAGTGRQPQNRFRWLRLGLLNVVFLIAPFGAWYIMQVQNTLETNTIRTFRALNEVDTALVDIVNNLPKIWEFSEKVQPYRQALSEADKNYKNTKGEEAISTMRTKNLLVPPQSATTDCPTRALSGSTPP